MKVDRFLRLAITFIVLLLFLIAVAMLFFVTESALNVWDRLLQGPAVMLYGYIALLVLLTAGTLWIIYKLVVRRPPANNRAADAPLTREQIQARLERADEAGVDVSEARSELAELVSRQADQAIHLCFFGEISAGKSSLIKALLPGADVSIDVVGGSTQSLRHYHWKTEKQQQVFLTDVPGTGSLDGEFEQGITEEAQRADVVLFVCDSDLTRQQIEGIKLLMSLEKPLIMVLNKADQYTVDEQSILMEHLIHQLHALDQKGSMADVVAVTAGGAYEVIEERADGQQVTATRQRPANVGALTIAINQLLTNSDELSRLRSEAIFQLTEQKLQQAEQEYRQQQAEMIVRSSTRKAVVGALAAVSPGTDIVIQGFIGTAMTRSLCKLYNAAPKDLDIENFLSLSQSRAGKVLPLSLAVAGNGLKAFPGVGTVAGGVVHAIAYGLIFDALGRSLVSTLENHGELIPEKAANEFEEGLSEHFKSSVQQITKMAMEQKSSERQ